MSKEIRNGIIGFAVVFLVGAALGALGDRSLSATGVAMGAGAFTWFILQSLSGNRSVNNVAGAERNRLLAEPPPLGQALIYVVREGFMGRAVGWEVGLDGSTIAQLKSPRFTRVVVAPGEHVLTAKPPGFAGAQSKAGSVSFTLAVGETAVFALKMQMGMTKNQIDILREFDARAGVARLASITMVAAETGATPLGTNPAS